MSCSLASDVPLPNFTSWRWIPGQVKAFSRSCLMPGESRKAWEKEARWQGHTIGFKIHSVSPSKEVGAWKHMRSLNDRTDCTIVGAFRALRHSVGLWFRNFQLPARVRVSHVLEQEARKAKIRAKGRAKGGSPKLLISPVLESLPLYIRRNSEGVPKVPPTSPTSPTTGAIMLRRSQVSAQCQLTSGPSNQKVLQTKSKKSAKPCILVKTNWW